MSGDGGAPLVLERGQHLSHSILWRLQRAYFLEKGIDAWRTGTVPHYVTSNPALARAYAQVVSGWLRDVAPSLDRRQPVHVVELGGGSGRFGYQFLRSFFDLHGRSVLRDVPVVYVMTDQSPATVDEWRAHPQLDPWFEAGLLQVACFDVEHDGALDGVTVANPLAVLANYVFDSLPHDAFTVRDGQLFEQLVTLEADVGGTDPDRLTVRYEPSPTTADHYDDAEWNAILRAYGDGLADTTVLLPVGALRCIDRLSRLAGGQLLVISADKGYHLAQAYVQAVDHLGPDDLFTLKKAVERQYEGWSITELVAYLRFTAWDPKVFFGCVPTLLDRVDGASEHEKDDLARLARHVWEAYFWIGEREDVPFELGLLCYGIGRLGDAAEYWGHSLRLHGPDPATLLNLATCRRELGEEAEARAYVDQLLALDPESEPARALLDELAG